jgi:hypothetical protein
MQLLPERGTSSRRQRRDAILRLGDETGAKLGGISKTPFFDPCDHDVEMPANLGFAQSFYVMAGSIDPDLDSFDGT